MNSWLRHHFQSLQQALTRFAEAPLASLANIVVVGVVLALPLGSYSLLSNLQFYAGSVPTEPQISIFLSTSPGRADVAALETRLRNAEGVRSVRFVPRDVALTSLKRLPGLNDVIASLRENPLPDAFVVTLTSSDADTAARLEVQFRGLPGVGTVQVDSAWVRRIESLLRIARSAVLMLALLLGFALVAVTFNTIRLQVLTQHEEIEVSKLVGATDAYVRRPFFYQGAALGVAGGIAALCIVQAAMLVFNTDLARLGPVFGILPVLRLLSFQDSLAFLSFAGILGWLGTYLAVSRHLLISEPR